MNKYILTTHNDVRVVTNESRTHRAQDLHVEEALADGLGLEEMLDLDGFMDDWVPLEDAERDWGAEIEVCESSLDFTVVTEEKDP